MSYIFKESIVDNGRNHTHKIEHEASGFILFYEEDTPSVLLTHQYFVKDGTPEYYNFSELKPHLSGEEIKKRFTSLFIEKQETFVDGLCILNLYEKDLV